ncbi:MAG: hypothetical protein RR387_05075 [Clostridiales bacterium]
MGDVWNKFKCGCQDLVTKANRCFTTSDLILLIVAALLLVSLMVSPALLVALALLGLFFWAIF